MPKRKRGNKPLWSVPRIQDPRYPKLTVRVTELSSGGTLYAVHRQAVGNEWRPSSSPDETSGRRRRRSRSVPHLCQYE